MFFFIRTKKYKKCSRHDIASCWCVVNCILSALVFSIHVDIYQAKDRSNPPEGSIVTTSMVRVAGKRNVPNCDFSRHIKCRNFWPHKRISSIFGSMSIYVMQGFQRIYNKVSITLRACNIMSWTQFLAFSSWKKSFEELFLNLLMSHNKSRMIYPH